MKYKYLILASLLPLAACGGAKESLGLNKKAPDEFSVVKRAPLAIPPDYALRPPAPGAPRPQEQSTDKQARMAVFGDDKNVTTQVSSGEGALLNAAGASNTNPNIRRTIDAESTDYGKENQPVVDKLLGLGGKKYVPPEEILDASEEAERLKNKDNKK